MQNQRALEKTIRELDRERNKLQIQEKKIISDIKKSAKENQTKAIKIQAKDLIRTQKNGEKFQRMKVQIQAIALRIQTVRSNEKMTQSMKSAAQLLGGMNRTMNLPQLSKITMDFQRESDMMDQRQEMMDDTMEDIMDDELDEEDEEEADTVVSKVLDQIGVDLSSSFKEAPSQAAAPERQMIGESAGDDDLQQRLDELKRG